MIHAHTHTDDWMYDIRFDATAWFEQADVSEIFALYSCGWGGNYPADAVVEWFDGEGTVPEICDMFRYIRMRAGKPGETGFECHIDEGEAVAWLNQHRPGWQHVTPGESAAPGRYGKIDRCECGGHTAHNYGKGHPGHAPYCPWAKKSVGPIHCSWRP